MRYTAKTDIGQKRKNNEDSYFAKIYDEDIALYIVADGLGGYNSGEVASQLAVKLVVENFEHNLNLLKSSSEDQVKSFFEQLIHITNEKVYEVQSNNEKYSGMGTTAVIVSVINNKIYYTSIGDTRIYYINDEKTVIKQVTTDDTYVNELLRKKLIKADEAINHPQKHVLTKAIGIFEKVEVKTQILNKENGYLILCSDGLTNMLNNKEIINVMRTNQFSKLSDVYVNLSNENGGSDNITVIVVEL